jgi:DNA-binding transcriptional LysR family regulator
MERFTALKVFCAVVERGSFAAAARGVDLSKAAVSKNVSELEAHLGARLLTRTTRRMSLTEAGERYYHDASRLLRELEDADEAVSEMTAAPRGRLRVSAPMSFGLRHLAPMIPAFLEHYPDVSVELEMSDAVVDLVGRQFDVAIRGHGALPDSSLIARRLTSLRRVICGAPAYFERHGMPQSPGDLGAHQCLIYTLSNAPDVWPLARNGRKLEVAVKGPYRVNNSLAIREALLAGTGIALIPKIYIEDALADGRLLTILDAWCPEEQWIYALYPAGRFTTKRVRAFVDFVAGRLMPPDGERVRRAGLRR